MGFLGMFAWQPTSTPFYSASSGESSLSDSLTGVLWLGANNIQAIYSNIQAIYSNIEAIYTQYTGNILVRFPNRLVDFPFLPAAQSVTFPGLLKQIHWLLFLPIAFICLFHFPIHKIISGTYQETISGRVCTLQPLSLVNEVSRKTTIGSQWYPHIANVFNLYFSYKV